MKLTARPSQIEAAKEAVAKEYGIHPDFFSIPNRGPIPVSDARFMLCLFLVSATGCSANQLGRILNRTQSSVRRGSGLMTQWMRLYPDVRKRYDRIVTDYLILAGDVSRP